MNLNDEIDISGAAEIIQKLIGWVGVVALILGGIAMYVAIPIIGKISCLYCPTPAGYLYILLAVLSGLIIWHGKIKYLYFTGGLAGILLAWDVYSSTTIGYALQMLISGGLAPSMGGQMDPVMTQMMQNTDLNIPLGWIVLAMGALLLILSPQMENKSQQEVTTSASPKEQNLKERMQELDSIVKMYKEGNLSGNEFSKLKEEIIGGKKNK